MTITCPKCNAPRQPSADPAASCPSCGVIYAKYDPAKAAELKARLEAVRRGENVAPIDSPLPKAPRHASRRESATDDRSSDGISQRQIIGLLGAAVLAIGVFMPLLSGPFGMSINYFANGKGDGVVLLVMAACTAALVFARKYQLLWATGGISLGMLVFTFYQLQTRMAEAKADMEREMAGNPFRGLADAALSTVQMQWGWAVLAVGIAMIFVCAALKQGRS